MCVHRRAAPAVYFQRVEQLGSRWRDARATDGGFGDAEGGADLAGAQKLAEQQLQCVSYPARAAPGCRHRWFRSKSVQRMPRSGHSEHRAGVRHQFEKLSAMAWNTHDRSAWPELFETKGDLVVAGGGKQFDDFLLVFLFV